jgi:DNA repair protein RecN (Recombination protein N)
MLTYINIKNLAIIKDLEVDFGSEMTSVTGETGAGKSIIVDSLELALGGRGDSSLIRTGQDRAEITIMFDLTNIPRARQWLINQELDSENECIIRRVITSDGRSKNSINENPCTQSTLRMFSEFLLNIHGQHEHQNLLNPQYQLELLDAFAETDQEATKIKDLYEVWQKTKKDLLELERQITDRETKIEFLNHQLKEFESIDFSAENIENLRQEQKRLNNLQEFLAAINTTLGLLQDNEDGSIISNLYTAKNQLEICQNIDEKMKPVVELINNIIIEAEEASSTLRQNLNNSENNPERANEIEEELSKIYTLSRKHHTEPTELPEVENNLKRQLDIIQSSASKIEKIKEELQKLEKDYLAIASVLSSKRKTAATKLNKLISEKMQLLGMIGGKFIANILPNTNSEFSPHGLEKVEFLVSANPGHPLQALNKTASGGELSRISLAIQVITAEKEVTPTLIFDEIDAGIGGRTADIVGKLLRKLSERAQIICITHLPQIAAQSHHQILVEKFSDTQNTTVSLTTLNKKERVKEIARMLGGVNTSGQALGHAEEMLNTVI